MSGGIGGLRLADRRINKMCVSDRSHRLIKHGIAQLCWLNVSMKSCGVGFFVRATRKLGG
jgi:hypothetical protein